MQRPQSFSHVAADPARERPGFYGLGMNVSVTDFGAMQWSHSGAFALGAATAFYLLPGSGFGVMALTNGAPAGRAGGILPERAGTGDDGRRRRATGSPWSGHFSRSEPGYGSGTDWDTPPADAAPPLPEAAYAGDVPQRLLRRGRDRGREDGLVLRIGPRALAFPLTHYERDTFSWQPIGENALGRSGLPFLVGPDGRTTAFSDEYLDKDGAGTLTRTPA